MRALRVKVPLAENDCANWHYRWQRGSKPDVGRSRILISHDSSGGDRKTSLELFWASMRHERRETERDCVCIRLRSGLWFSHQTVQPHADWETASLFIAGKGQGTM